VWTKSIGLLFRENKLEFSKTLVKYGKNGSIPLGMYLIGTPEWAKALAGRAQDGSCNTARAAGLGLGAPDRADAGSARARQRGRRPRVTTSAFALLTSTGIGERYWRGYLASGCMTAEEEWLCQ
jgi:hypothetical protein